MEAPRALRLADLVEESLGVGHEAEEVAEPEKGTSPAEHAELRDVSAELSALLVELAHAPEESVDVASGWTPGLEPGSEVGRFVLRREIGRGGFGVVYEALDRDLGRPVAFKALRPGRRLVGRNVDWLRGEAEAVAKLNHPNIVTLHDFGRGPMGPYLIFELLRGETLADRLRAGSLPLREAVAVATDVARVLAHAHKAGVVHRDLKPANVFLCEDGAVKVLDFGLAHLFGRAGAVSGGTPTYMAPEQWRGEPGDERTDLFSLGVLVFQMITGRAPYRVSREHSEAQEPGPPPELPRDVAPAALRSLSTRLLQKDPPGRPATSREVLEALLAIGRRLDGTGSRRRVAWAAVAAVAAVAVGIGADLVKDDPPPPGPVSVAVADFENGTGERELDGLSLPLATSLEQSRVFQVLTRARLMALLRAAGRPATERIEGDVARELARTAGARVLLTGSARRDGGAFAIELRAVEPTDGRRLFALTERAAVKAEIFPAVDRLSAAVRAALRERRDEVQRAQIRIAQAFTSSIEAYQAYFEGVDCIERPSLGKGWVTLDAACAGNFRRALALDPTFALAHYQLAFLLGLSNTSSPELPVHLESALRYVDRVPPKEAALIRAWNEHIKGRDGEALAMYGNVLAEYPEEVHALFISGQLLVGRGELAAAVPFFEKALSIDPGSEWALDSLVNAQGALRRHDELRALLARLGEVPRTAAESHARVRGLVWLGEPRAALEAARGAVERGFGPAAESDLQGALSIAGELAEGEAMLRARTATEQFRLATWYSLAGNIGLQGRRAEGLRVLDGLADRVTSGDRGAVQFVRAMYVAGDGDPAVSWREAAKTKALAPAFAGDLAIPLALFGDLPHAAELAELLPARSTAAEEHAALVAWRGGDAAGAAARLAVLDARDPWPNRGLAPSYLLAEVSADARDWRATLEAVNRFRSLWPRGMWRSWAIPRVHYLAALAHAELGEREHARAELGRLLALWHRADRELPLLRDARALGARLEP